MRMTKEEWRFHKETNDAWYQSYKLRCACRDIKKAIRDKVLEPLYNFMVRIGLIHEK